MFQGRFLVTGATGDTGGATVEELLARGHQVRALAHGEDERSKRLQGSGVEVIYGDLLDFGQVRAALTGVQRAYFIYPIRPGILQATAYFAQAAKEAGLDGMVNMSQISARETRRVMPRPSLALRARLRLVRADGRPHPAYLLRGVAAVTRPTDPAGLLHVPFGTGRHAPIVRGPGRVIAGILEDPAQHKGEIYPLFGPVEYTYGRWPRF